MRIVKLRIFIISEFFAYNKGLNITFSYNNGDAMSSAGIILKELERITGTDEVRLNPDLALYDADLLDSLGTVELIVALGEQLKIEISPAQINRQLWATPNKIISYIDERLGG